MAPNQPTNQRRHEVLRNRYPASKRNDASTLDTAQTIRLTDIPIPVPRKLESREIPLSTAGGLKISPKHGVRRPSFTIPPPHKQGAMLIVPQSAIRLTDWVRSRARDVTMIHDAGNRTNERSIRISNRLHGSMISTLTVKCGPVLHSLSGGP